MRDFVDAAIALFEGRGLSAGELAEIERGFFRYVTDPEGLYYGSRHLAQMGEVDVSLREFVRAADGGYSCYPVFRTDRWLADMRGQLLRSYLQARTRAATKCSIEAFTRADGEAPSGRDARALKIRLCDLVTLRKKVARRDEFTNC